MSDLGTPRERMRTIHQRGLKPFFCGPRTYDIRDFFSTLSGSNIAPPAIVSTLGGVVLPGVAQFFRSILNENRTCIAISESLRTLIVMRQTKLLPPTTDCITSHVRQSPRSLMLDLRKIGEVQALVILGDAVGVMNLEVMRPLLRWSKPWRMQPPADLRASFALPRLSQYLLTG